MRWQSSMPTTWSSRSMTTRSTQPMVSRRNCRSNSSRPWLSATRIAAWRTRSTAVSREMLTTGHDRSVLGKTGPKNTKSGHGPTLQLHSRYDLRKYIRCPGLKPGTSSGWRAWPPGHTYPLEHERTARRRGYGRRLDGGGNEIGQLLVTGVVRMESIAGIHRWLIDRGVAHQVNRPGAARPRGVDGRRKSRGQLPQPMPLLFRIPDAGRQPRQVRQIED